MASPGGKAASPWIWSDQYQNYYMVSTDGRGNPTYQWAPTQPQTGPAVPAVDPVQRPRTDSAFNSRFSTKEEVYRQQSVPSQQTSYEDAAVSPLSAAPDVRAQLHNFIPGTPEQGWYESLDPSYRMRTGAEAHSFFRLGRVFAMLHIQAASETALPSDSVTVVKYGERAFSQIRRFVIVEVRHGFVYACPITTYSGRATLKSGCSPREHSVVYLEGQQPTVLAGEYLEKEPICIIPADASVQMHIASRLHYNKAWPVEMNVKVKHIGDVDPKDLSNLLRYYREENNIRD